MEQIIGILIEGFMNSLEEFVSAIKFPTQAYTRKAFIVSLIFLGAVIALEIFGIGTIVKWDTALTCSILLGIVAFIDATTRSSAKKLASKLGSSVVQTTHKLKSAVIVNKTIGNDAANEYVNTIDDDYFENNEYYEEVEDNGEQ